MLRVADKLLTQTAALPNGAAATSVTGFDIGPTNTVLGAHVAEVELEISAPALVVGDLADGSTMTYSIETDDNAAFSSATILYANVLIQTGAGGAGAAAATKRVRLATNVERFVRVKATNSAAGDASDKSMTVKLLF